MSNERKIIHVDMDCFFAAIEQRENPALRGKPIAVGGDGRRGVLCTASYEARKFGCRSAMPGFKALELCPQLIIVPVRFELYQQASNKVRAIFGRFTELIEPLSLDEAYLDVSHWKSDAGAIAREIRAQIYEETQLTASAGISSNKLIAKIASDWQKPNGQHQIKPEEIPAFMENLPVAKLWGVGKKMQQKLTSANIHTCGDMQKLDKLTMAKNYGKWGLELYDLCRGIDTREVQTSRIRKSIGKEITFDEDINRVQDLFADLEKMLESVREIHQDRYRDRIIKSTVVKLKFADFTGTTIERATEKPSMELARELLLEGWSRGGQKSVRLLGIGLKLADPEPQTQPQLELGME
ncbi:MAG: DNA polymerase IV [Akkermansiaceae bacterium]